MPQTLTCKVGALSTGIRTVDMQHQELLQQLEAFEAAHAAGDSLNAVDTLLPQLEAYVLFHFGEEERLMSNLANEHAFVQMHLAQHQAFIDELTVLKQTAPQSDAAALADQLVARVRPWLLNHIGTTDVTLGRKWQAQRTIRFAG